MYFPQKCPTHISNKPAWWGVGTRDSTLLLFSFQIPSQQPLYAPKWCWRPNITLSRWGEANVHGAPRPEFSSQNPLLPPSSSQPHLLDLAAHVWAGGDERPNLPFKLVPLNQKPWAPLPQAFYARSPRPHTQVESAGKGSHSAFALNRGGGRAVSHYPACQ